MDIFLDLDVMVINGNEKVYFTIEYKNNNNKKNLSIF